jgi:Uma2 family endonuclease
VSTAFQHILPWTEEDYLALGETADRVELFDGSLLVSPAPTPRHQRISFNLATSMTAAASAAGLDVYEAINIRLKHGRIPIPDLAVVGPIDLDEPVVDVSAVQLICEIVSPGNPASDRVIKMHYYAEAGIPWYLLVEQEPEVTLRLLRYENGHYVEHAVGRVGAPLRMTEPVTVDLDPGDLID